MTEGGGLSSQDAGDTVVRMPMMRLEVKVKS